MLKKRIKRMFIWKQKVEKPELTVDTLSADKAGIVMDNDEAEKHKGV